MKVPIAVLTLVSFLMTAILGPMPVYAQDEFKLPEPGVMVYLSPQFDPPILKGIKVHADNPFRFDFILDKGEGQLSNDTLKDESSKLIKYFLASLTIPEKDLWVNLSPYEKDRIIPNSFGLTEMGRDLLAEDYMLKQITASLIYPEDTIGKKFWKRIYEEAQKRYGTTDVPVNTFNKVWIVPAKAVVYENAKAGTAYVVESKLKVMLEQDYLSLEKHEGIQSEQAQTRNSNQLGSQIVREIVIPQLAKEVNENKNFARLRQVYNSLILATWYKKKMKDSILDQVYADRNKIVGVKNDDAQEKDKIYQRYLRAFKKGVYNYIKEEIDPMTQESIPRKYFSGGVLLKPSEAMVIVANLPDAAMLEEEASNGRMVEVLASASPSSGFSRRALFLGLRRESSHKEQEVSTNNETSLSAIIDNNPYFRQTLKIPKSSRRTFLTVAGLAVIGHSLFPPVMQAIAPQIDSVQIDEKYQEDIQKLEEDLNNEKFTTLQGHDFMPETVKRVLLGDNEKLRQRLLILFKVGNISIIRTIQREIAERGYLEQLKKTSHSTQVLGSILYYIDQDPQNKLKMNFEYFDLIKNILGIEGFEDAVYYMCGNVLIDLIASANNIINLNVVDAVAMVNETKSKALNLFKNLFKVQMLQIAERLKFSSQRINTIKRNIELIDSEEYKMKFKDISEEYKIPPQRILFYLTVPSVLKPFFEAQERNAAKQGPTIDLDILIPLAFKEGYIEFARKIITYGESTVTDKGVDAMTPMGFDGYFGNGLAGIKKLLPRYFPNDYKIGRFMPDSVFPDIDAGVLINPLVEKPNGGFRNLTSLLIATWAMWLARSEVFLDEYLDSKDRQKQFSEKLVIVTNKLKLTRSQIIIAGYLSYCSAHPIDEIKKFIPHKEEPLRDIGPNELSRLIRGHDTKNANGDIVNNRPPIINSVQLASTFDLLKGLHVSFNAAMKANDQVDLGRRWLVTRGPAVAAVALLAPQELLSLPQSGSNYSPEDIKDIKAYIEGLNVGYYGFDQYVTGRDKALNLKFGTGFINYYDQFRYQVHEEIMTKGPVSVVELSKIANDILAKGKNISPYQQYGLEGFFKGIWSDYIVILANDQPELKMVTQDLIYQARKHSAALGDMIHKLTLMIAPGAKDDLRNNFMEEWVSFNETYFIPKNYYVDIRVESVGNRLRYFSNVYKVVVDNKLRKVNGTDVKTVYGRKMDRVYSAGDLGDSLLGHRLVFIDLNDIDSEVKRITDTLLSGGKHRYITMGGNQRIDATALVIKIFSGKDKDYIREMLLHSTRAHEFFHQAQDMLKHPYKGTDRFGLSADIWERVDAEQRKSLDNETGAMLAQIVSAKEPGLELFDIFKFALSQQDTSYSHGALWIMNRLDGRATDQWTDGKDLKELVSQFMRIYTLGTDEIKNRAKKLMEENWSGELLDAVVNSDSAMYSTPSKSSTGGIDLTLANKVIETQNTGEGIKFHLNPSQLAQLQNAPGFVPLIINIQPLKSLEEFLGLRNAS